ncbi:hypothetical protein IFR05_002829 [Cadophora sp. M221]|nr:hypothetical protein IFR05_002829 [Cadophora sp. M221]
MSKSESDSKVAAAVEDDDEPDEWDKRIFSTGCAVENTKMTDCYWEKKDWRLCKDEVGGWKLSLLAIPSHITWMKELLKLLLMFWDDTQMENFKKCWKQHQNDKRTDSKDA